MTIADVVNQFILVDYIGGMAWLAYSVAYISGIGFAFKGVLALKDITEKKQSPAKAIILLAAAGMMMAVPTVLIIGQNALGITQKTAPLPNTAPGGSKY